MTMSPAAMGLIREGPLVRVDVYDHPAMRGNVPYNAGSLVHESALFLVDTGSQMTFIERSLIASLGLEPTGATVDVLTMAGRISCMSYHAELVLALDKERVPFTTTIVRVDPGEFFPRPRFQGILGRNALHRLKFAYNGSLGTFQISPA